MTTESLAVLGALTGVVGALTGVAALIWQVVAHRRAGRLVSVLPSYVIPVYGPAHAPEFHDDDQIALTVTNRGGAPVTVLNYGVAIGSRGKVANLFVVERHALTTPLPAVVEPGGQPVQLTIPVDRLRQTHRDQGTPFRKMRPWVDLGDGRRIYSKRPVPLR